MDTFLIIGICFLCYEVCDLIIRYATPPNSGSQDAEPLVTPPSPRVYSISQKIPSPIHSCETN